MSAPHAVTGGPVPTVSQGNENLSGSHALVIDDTDVYVSARDLLGATHGTYGSGRLTTDRRRVCWATSNRIMRADL